MKLSEIATNIATQLGKAYDIPYRKRIQDNVIFARAEIIRRNIDKGENIPDSFLIQIPCLDVSYVDIAECADVDLNCDVLRTVEKIPKPIRSKNNLPSGFSYFGSIDGMKPFTYIQPEDLKFYLSDSFTKHIPFYSYINEYGYIFNVFTKHIRVRYPVANPLELEGINLGDGVECEYDPEIPEDLVFLIKDLVYREMGIKPIDDKVEESSEVKIEEDE